MLFLGAGASKPLGIPTMAEFTDVVIKDLTSTSLPYFEGFVRNLQSMIENVGLRPDIEGVLSVIQSIGNPQKALEDIGPPIVLFSEKAKVRDIVGRNPMAEIATEVEEAIFRRCAKLDHKKAYELYDQLWKSLTTDAQTRTTVFGDNDVFVRRIFTTNYDLGVEAFLKRKRLRYADGFQVDEVSDATFTGHWEEAQVHFGKLHGSINYFSREDGQIVRSDAILENADAYGREVKGRIMIYPTGEKYATRRPFYEELGQLRAALADQYERVCIVIGYSFRDHAINNAFFDGIAMNPKLRIVWVTPHSNSNFRSLDPILQGRIIPYSAEFGDQSTPQGIMNEIRGKVDA